MFCSECGAQIPEGSRFCENCGAKVGGQKTGPQQPQMVPPVQMTPVTGGQQTGPQQLQTGQPVQMTPVTGGQQMGPQQIYTDQQTQIPPTQIPPVQQTVPPYGAAPQVVQKDTFYVRRLPIIIIIVMTIGLFFGSVFVGEDTSMTIALAVSSVPGIILLILIYKLDAIEPEPIGLLVKLFLLGGLLLPVIAILLELVLEIPVSLLFSEGSILYCFFESFVVAACCEELCKYAVLKKITWKHPAFNYRFDGVVYSTTVAIGFEIVENIIYLIGSTADTAFTRAAFPGHCIFGIYMGYFYGQAKTLELMGDVKGSASMRKKGLITAIGIHGFYDFVCFLGEASGYEFIQIIMTFVLVGVMTVLNVTAYKNIKKFAHEDAPV